MANKKNRIKDRCNTFKKCLTSQPVCNNKENFNAAVSLGMMLARPVMAVENRDIRRGLNFSKVRALFYYENRALHHNIKVNTKHANGRTKGGAGLPLPVCNNSYWFLGSMSLSASWTLYKKAEISFPPSSCNNKKQVPGLTLNNSLNSRGKPSLHFISPGVLGGG